MMLRPQFPRCLITIALVSLIWAVRYEQFWADLWGGRIYS